MRLFRSMQARRLTIAFSIIFSLVAGSVGLCQDVVDRVTATDQGPVSGLSIDKVRAHFEKTRSEKAARWLLANAYPQEKWKTLRSSQRKLLEEVLLAIPNATPDDAKFKVAYAELLAAKKLEEQAVPFLLSASDLYPNLGIHAAKILEKSGDQEQADEIAQKVLAAFKKLHADEPEDTTHTTGLASAYLLLRQNTDALMTLIKASKEAKGEDNLFRLNQAIGETIVVWIVGIENDEIDPSNPTVSQRDNIWKMLDSAVDVAPNNAPVINEVRKQLMELAKKDDAEIRKSRDTLFGGTQPGFFELVRGVAALVRNDERIAGQHLTRSLELSPKLTVVIKNLAIAFASNYNDIVGNKEVLELGLKLSNVALKKTSDPEPGYYETRGQILYRMKRFEEAIPDLEKATEDPAREDAMKRMLELCKLYVTD